MKDITDSILVPIAEPGLAYADPNYAASFREFGKPLELPRCAGWLLSRTIPGTDDRDAATCYPLFSCQHWDQLGRDLEDLPGTLVSATVLTTPFCGVTPSVLRVHFDVVKHYKDHFLTDLRRPIDTVISRHHRRYVRKALDRISVEPCDPATALDEWCALYEQIIVKHGVKGIRAFSRECFRGQLGLRGAVLLKAVHEDRTVGMHWYLTVGDVAYYHLGGLAPEAYALYASFALHYTAIELLRDDFQWLVLGAGAGVSGASADGLEGFKRGWSTDAMPTYLCGKVLAPERFAELSRGRGDSDYFPAYRYGEFQETRSGSLS